MSRIQTSTPAYDFYMDVALGRVPNATGVNKFGRNFDLNSTTEDVWDRGGLWVAPTAARQHNLVSDSGLDTLGGTGANIVRVFGLTDWDSVQVSEDIEMTGIVPVVTNFYVIIHRMVVISSGTAAPNVGTITATTIGETVETVTAQILPLTGQTQMAIYGWPSVQTFFPTLYYAGINKANNAAVNVTGLFNGGPESPMPHPVVKGTLAVNAGGASFIERNPNPPGGLKGPGILQLQADATTNNVDVSAGFDGVLWRTG